MSSHMSCIGFPIYSGDDFRRFAQQLENEGTMIPVRAGSYLYWRGTNGEEIWIGADKHKNVVSMVPYHAGSSQIHVEVRNRITRREASPLDGAFYAWVGNDEDKEDPGYPVVFDCPDYHCYADARLPLDINAAITAFPDELEVYESEEVYGADQSKPMKLASRAFIPSGLFNQGSGQPMEPQSLALITGVVKEAGVKTNPISRMTYWTAVVSSYGGDYNMVFDSESLKRPLKPGNVIQAECWLCGRLKGEWSPKPGGLLSRFFRKA